MAVVKTFRELNVWRKAHELVRFIYKITKNFPDDEKYVLVSQLRKAALSIASNIVEGFKRKSKKDSLNFYNIADSSLEEVKYQLLVSRDLGYINKETCLRGIGLCEEVGRLLNSWVSCQK